MKRTHLGLMAAACALGLSWTPLQAQRKMVVEMKEGQPAWEYDLAAFDRLTFGEGNLSVVGADAQTLRTAALKGIAQITFAAAQSGIDAPDAQTDGLTLRHDGRLLRIDGLAAGTVAPLTLYSAAGARLLSLPAWSGEPVSTAALPPGVYLLRVNKQTFKFTK